MKPVFKKGNKHLMENYHPISVDKKTTVSSTGSNRLKLNYQSIKCPVKEFSQSVEGSVL